MIKYIVVMKISYVNASWEFDDAEQACIFMDTLNDNLIVSNEEETDNVEIYMYRTKGDK